MEYSKEKFVQLFNALAEADRDEQELRLKKRLDLMESAPVIQMEGFEIKRSGKFLPAILKLIAVAVAVTAVVFTIKYYNTGAKKSTRIFMAIYGERKNIQLPDGSDVSLNAGSKIEINENFGIAGRDVYLEGEAFFDVKHNSKIPFIVHTPRHGYKGRRHCV